MKNERDHTELVRAVRDGQLPAGRSALAQLAGTNAIGSADRGSEHLDQSNRRRARSFTMTNPAR